MPITLPPEARQQAISSLERYVAQELDERIGNIAAAGLLNFFLQEIAPEVYNQAVADVQERLRQRVAEVDLEVHEDEFAYWRAQDSARRGRR